jgi:hypothetical protein
MSPLLFYGDYFLAHHYAFFLSLTLKIEQNVHQVGTGLENL